MNQSQSTKWMSNGEAGLAAFFSATAFLCLIAAAKGIRFVPATKDGHPVSMWMELQYNFNLY